MEGNCFKLQGPNPNSTGKRPVEFVTCFILILFNCDIYFSITLLPTFSYGNRLCLLFIYEMLIIILEPYQ